MIPPVPQESSALNVITPPTSTRENNRQFDEKDSLYCDYCHKRRHTRETCYKLNGRPQWQNNNRRGGNSSGSSGGRRGDRSTGSKAYNTTDEMELQSTSAASGYSHSSQDQLERMIKECARMLSSKENAAGSTSLAQPGPTHRSDDWTW